VLRNISLVCEADTSSISLQQEDYDATIFNFSDGALGGQCRSGNWIARHQPLITETSLCCGIKRSKWRIQLVLPVHSYGGLPLRRSAVTCTYGITAL